MCNIRKRLNDKAEALKKSFAEHPRVKSGCYYGTKYAFIMTPVSVGLTALGKWCKAKTDDKLSYVQPTCAKYSCSCTMEPWQDTAKMPTTIFTVTCPDKQHEKEIHDLYNQYDGISAANSATSDLFAKSWDVIVFVPFAAAAALGFVRGAMWPRPEYYKTSDLAQSLAANEAKSAATDVERGLPTQSGAAGNPNAFPYAGGSPRAQEGSAPQQAQSKLLAPTSPRG